MGANYEFWWLLVILAKRQQCKLLPSSNFLHCAFQSPCIAFEQPQTAEHFLNTEWPLMTVLLDCNPVLSFPKGSMQEKTGWDHSGNERHFSCNGSVFVPSQLWQERILQAQAGEFASEVFARCTKKAFQIFLTLYPVFRLIASTFSVQVLYL